MQTVPRRAQAALSLVFLIGGIVFIAGVSIAFFAISFVNSGYGFETTQRLNAAVAAGVSDALLQLDRNSGFSSPGYTIPVDNITVTVTVSTPVSNQVTITSAASSGLRSRSVRAVVGVDPTTGQVTPLSIQ
jgi:hypothetical protein